MLKVHFGLNLGQGGIQGRMSCSFFSWAKPGSLLVIHINLNQTSSFPKECLRTYGAEFQRASGHYVQPQHISLQDKPFNYYF